MSPRRHVQYLFLSLLLLFSIGHWAHAQQPAFPQRSTDSLSKRMRVVESPSRTNVAAVSAPFAYSVVGAVDRPGVYTTTQPSLSIRQLVDSAGGLTAQAQTTLRVVRNNDVRFQVQYLVNGRGADEMLLPGDILVVPLQSPMETANAHPDAMMPVACLGLLDRPVVLPLDLSITTVQELTRRLGQHPQLAQTAHVIEPVRGRSPTELASGSVIIFESRLVDRLPLTSQPGFLPAPIPLDGIRTSASPEPVLPTQEHQLPGAPPVQSVQSVQQASANLPGRMTDLIAPPQQQQLTNQPALPSLELPVMTAQNAPEEIPGDHDANATTDIQVVTNGSATTQTTESSAQAGTVPLPNDLAQALELFAPVKQPRHPTPQPLLPRQDSLQTPDSSQSVTSQQSTRRQDVMVESVPSTTISALAETESHAAAPVTQTGGQTPNLIAKIPSARIEALRAAASGQSFPSSEKVQLDSKESTSPKPIPTLPRMRKNGILGYLLFCGAALSILVGCSLMISMIFASHGPSSTTQIDTPATLDSEPDEASPTSAAKSAGAPQSATGTQIKELLNRELPMIEVPVQIPAAWPLHGKVVGHRRCLLNAAHEEIPGPHFGKRQNLPECDLDLVTSTQTAERQLRKSLREICRADHEVSSKKSGLAESDHSVKTDIQSDEPASRGPVFQQPVPREAGGDRECGRTVNSPLNPPAPANVASARNEAGRPASTIGNPDFDIVQPPPHAPAQTSTMSPLERALRTLATEKRA